MLKCIPNASASLVDAVWLDLLDPSPEERAAVEQATKLRLPAKDTIEEIEHSSRAFLEGEALYLSTPVLARSDGRKNVLTTVGFVLSRELLVTLRFAPIRAFDDVAASFSPAAALGASDAFLKLLEKIVDHTADFLEHAGAELEGISHAAFHADRPRAYKLAQASGALHGALRKLGRMADGMSHVRDTLLGVDRIAAFVAENASEARAAPAPLRLTAIRDDIRSLKDHQTHLSNKIQFLLDATLGFISIQQNDIVKTLTIVSVVGVPPLLIAGIYGMNFEFMPELRWAFGYPFALGLIVLSAVVPVAWFKWRGWM